MWTGELCLKRACQTMMSTFRVWSLNVPSLPLWFKTPSIGASSTFKLKWTALWGESHVFHHFQILMQGSRGERKRTEILARVFTGRVRVPMKKSNLAINWSYRIGGRFCMSHSPFSSSCRLYNFAIPIIRYLNKKLGTNTWRQRADEIQVQFFSFSTERSVETISLSESPPTTSQHLLLG